MGKGKGKGGKGGYNRPYDEDGDDDGGRPKILPPQPLWPPIPGGMPEIPPLYTTLDHSNSLYTSQ